MSNVVIFFFHTKSHTTMAPGTFHPFVYMLRYVMLAWILHTMGGVGESREGEMWREWQWWRAGQAAALGQAPVPP